MTKSSLYLLDSLYQEERYSGYWQEYIMCSENNILATVR